MYAVVGIAIAEEVYTGTLDKKDPVGAVVVVSVHVKLEEAQAARDQQELLGKKSPVPFSFFVERLGIFKLIKLTENEKELEAQPEKPMPDSATLPDPTELEKLATSFSTLLHSMSVRDHSSGLLDQANKSIPVRASEVKEALSSDPKKYEELKKFYLNRLPEDAPVRARILKHLEDVDDRGIPKCLNFSV